MDNKYIVYEVYGKDKPSKYLQGITQKVILGKTREYDSINSVWNAIDNNSLNLRTNTIMIIDWNHYRIKTIHNGNPTIWKKFKARSFFNEFRFMSPCDEWEFDSKGYIEDTIMFN